jgi:hypothetical protein
VIARASAEARNSNACHDGAFANTIRAHDGLQRLPRASGGAHPARAQNGRPHRRRRLPRAQPHRTARRRRPRRAHRRARRRAAPHGGAQDPLLQGRPDAAHRGRALAEILAAEGSTRCCTWPFSRRPRTRAPGPTSWRASARCTCSTPAASARAQVRALVADAAVRSVAVQPQFLSESHPLRATKRAGFCATRSRPRPSFALRRRCRDRGDRAAPRAHPRPHGEELPHALPRAKRWSPR